MSASSDSDETDVWPGFVDALTTMTMVMTLIMMLLAIVVFGLSQSISRKFIEQIAEVASVDAGQQRSTEAITADIIDHFLRRPDQQTPVPVAAGVPQAPAAIAVSAAPTVFVPSPRPPAPTLPEPTSVPALGSPEPMPVQQDASDSAGELVTGRVLSGSPNATVKGPSGGPAEAARTAPTAAPPDRVVASLNVNKAESDNKTAVGNSPPPPSDPQVIESKREADLTRVLDGAVLGAGLTVVNIKFKEKAVQLDGEAFAQLKQATASGTPFSQARTIEIRGVADLVGSTVSDARRVAYYRVLSVRQSLIEAGLPANRFSVKIEDSLSGSNENIVKITAVQ